MKHKLAKRLILDLLLIFSVLNGWWAFSLFFGLIGLCLFDYFIEIIFAGIIFDSIFGQNTGSGFWSYFGIVFSILFFALITWLRQVLRR